MKNSQFKNEATVQDEVRHDSSATHNGLLMRNNVGVFNPKFPPRAGLRWGLANDTPKMNKEIKSSDLIGIVPVTITPEMVGKTVGVFMAIECKPENFCYNPNDSHQKAQHKFHTIVQRLGGVAGFASSVIAYQTIIYDFYQRLIKP